jgi:hypothetical protein
MTRIGSLLLTAVAIGIGLLDYIIRDGDDLHEPR